jgi:predicted HTH transcriptional regulator
MSEEIYRSIVFAGREDRNREYKASFPWDRKKHGDTIARVVKTILAMSNLRDGGHVVIGVDEITTPKGTEHRPIGVQDAHLSTYSYDQVADSIKVYADPSAPFSLDVISLDGMNFVVIAVVGFDEYPVICKTNFGDNILANGVIYYRPKSGRPRSEPISSYVDMRELMDLAVERGVKRYIQLQARISTLGASDQESFQRQLGDFS